jgi:molybdate transport system substrate-binding protein
MVMERRFIFLWVSLVLALPVISGPRAWGAQELTVSAAASLTNVFQALGQGFEKANPGTKTILNFAASGTLLHQIDKGAPVDVFASADQKTMDQAQAKGLIVVASRKDFVSNRLVLIIPAESKLALKTPNDLKLPEVKKVALGNPETAPVGRYTKEALTGLGLWNALIPKFIYGETVRQVLDYVSRGEVDAGFVYATDVVIAKGKVRTITEVKEHKAIVYPIAIVATSGKKELAQSFINYVLSPEARIILGKYGFGRP